MMMLSTLPLLAAAASGLPSGAYNASDASSLKLNDGLTFPFMSFGLQVYDDGTAQTLTTTAIKAGVRNFFSSVLAGNQAGFGAAVKASSVPRKELFICGSVNTGNGQCSGGADCYTQTAQGCADNLQTLGLGYVDMIMLDYPASDCASIVGQWRAFEEMLARNGTRSIAVSNFSPDQLDCILANKSATVPSVNQMSYSVGSGSDTVVSDDAQRGGIVVQAYSPLQSGGLVGDPDCVAIGKAHKKSGAQVALRWIVQHNATFTTSVDTAAHFADDLDIFDFALTPSEMKRLDAKMARRGGQKAAAARW